MAREQKPTEWVQVLLRRFRHQLPYEQHQKPHGEETYKLVQQSLVKLSSGRFTDVVTTLATYIRDLNYMQTLSVENQEFTALSNITILETLEQCFRENPNGNANLSDDVVQRQLLPVLCPLIIQPENIMLSKQMYSIGGKVLFLISVFHFTSVFRRVMQRVHRLVESGEDLSSVSAVDEIELLKHLHVNRDGLINVIDECSRHFKSLKKYSQLALIKALNKVIWNWIEQYPEQFSALYKEEYLQLSDASDKLFALLENYSDSTKKKIASWPLQCMLLLLCPNSVREAAGSGSVSRAQNHMKRQFIENLKKGLSGSKGTIESSVLGCVQLCKASTFIDREENVVSFLVALVLNELKARCYVRFMKGPEVDRAVAGLLYNQQKPFHPTSITIPVEDLMTDCFVSSFRTNYRNNQHFEICFSTESYPIFQLAMVVGLHRVINETPLLWWPKIDVMYSKAHQLRFMFQAVIKRVTMNENVLIRGAQGRSSMTKIRGEKKKDEEHVSLQKDLQLLLWLVKLFHADPMLALHRLIRLRFEGSRPVHAKNPGKAGHEIQASSMIFMNGLVAVMLSNIVGEVASEAAETLSCLHSVEHIHLWNPEAPIATFWEISSIIIFHVADCILQERVPSQLKMMQWLEQILQCRIDFLSANKDQATIGTHIPICAESLTKLEIIFLSSLWSSEQDKILLAMTCFGLLNEEACLLNTADNYNIIHPAPLQTVYHKLANEVNRVKTGRTALQKRIMAILREVGAQTQGNTQAWDLTYSKWQKLTDALANFPREEFPPLDSQKSAQSMVSSRKSVAGQPGPMATEMMETYLLEWTNMTGFLCSLGGINVQQDRRDEENQKKKGGPTTLKNLTTSNILADSSVNRFVKELLTLLICNNDHTSLQIRNGVKESLAVDLSPALYPAFFLLCRATTECFFTDNGQVKMNESHTTYIEQLIYILRNILDNKSEEVSSVLSHLAIEDIVLCIIKYIRNLPINVQSLVIKAKLCQLAESIMSRHSDLSFRQEMKFRNKLVEYLTEWVLSASDRINSVSAEVLAISCTLDEAAMKAIVVLLKGLPLQPETVESDIMEAKSQLFLKHFTLFMNILNKCYEASEDKDVTTRGSTLAPHYASLRTNTVQAMSNMLSANIDSGLMHSISLGYHEDPQTRSTFMEVLTDILKQGTEFDNLAETVIADRFERLVGLVTLTSENEDLPIATALANVVPSEQMDELAQVLINIFDAKGMLYDLLWNLFKQEVLHAEGIQTVFRGNSLASKAMTYSFKIHGSGYLQTLLEPLVASMMENQARSFEVDPMRIDPSEDITVNRMHLTALAQSFVERITASKESMPQQLRSLCFCLSKAVRERFPSNTFDAVSSAIFLRFINPAIVSPHALGIINQLPPDKVRRGLMLLSKILQNLANHLLFTKEPHMDVFNQFLENNFCKIEKFFGEISSEPPSREKADSGFSFISDQNVYALHRLLWNNQEKIGSYLAIHRDFKSRGKGPFERMATLLAHLGPPDHQPVKLQKPWLRTNSIASKFTQFMAKHADHNQDELQALKSLQLFYQEGKSKSGHPVFYYVARRYRSDQVNDELLIYHVLLTLQHAYGQHWDLVIDFSHTNPENIFKADTLTKAFVVLPGSQVKSLSLVYIFNANSSIRQYVKVNERILSPLKGKGNVILVDNLSKFYDYIEPNQLKLPGTTMSLEDDIKTFCVQRISNRGNVLVKVGPNSVQVQNTERIKILGYPCLVNDVFYANEVEGASFIEDMLELQFTTVGPSMRFISNQAEEVAGAVNHVMQRWKLSHATNESIAPNKKIRPKDVPGTILNMAVLNLGSRDPSLRLAAYNLLCALTSTFSLHIEERLLEANGLCIPANNTMFIKSLSEQLAKREPGMTLEFLDECIGGFSKSDYELKHLCLEYMAPWLPNLTRFCNTSQDDPVRIKLNQIFEKLIQLTIQERQLYPSIQAKVWGNIGKVSELLDVVLDSFIKTSATGGLGSTKAEVMADTAVALAAANVPLVSSKIIGRLHTVIGRTSVSPTLRLEQHLMWDDIAILARYLLMLSFNDCLNVSQHLPDICHITSLLLATGPLSLRASIHGLVINSVQSLLTCSGINFTDETRRLLRTRLEDLSMQKFYLLFGISKVKSAPVKAFKTSKRARNRTLSRDTEEDQISMSSIETVVETMLEIIETCSQDIPKSDWLRRWYDLALGFTFQHNPAIQPRAIIVLGCISREVDDLTIRSLFQVLLKAVGVYHDNTMVEAVVMCLAKMQPLLPKESKYHKALFWVAVGILQLSQQSLYPSGLSLLEQNLSTLDNHGLFTGAGVAEVLAEVRKDPLLDWSGKQMDHFVGLSFSTNFHFALCALILKGLRHPFAKTKSSAVRLLNLMLNICNKHRRSKDKFAVNGDTVAYLAALLPQSEDVRMRLQAEARAQLLRTPSMLSHHSKSGSVASPPADEGEPHVAIMITTSTMSEEPEAYVWPAECHNLLLDPGVLTDTQTKALLFVLLAALVEYTTDDAESRVLYEVLAEASIAFPDIFSITFPILNRKLSNVLSHSEDPVTLAAVQTIVESTARYASDKPGMKMQFLSACGFFGLHSFPGPFIEAADPAMAPLMFSRLIEGFLDKYTPTSMLPEARSNSVQLFKPVVSVDDNALLSSSLSHIPATDAKKTFKRVGSLSPAKLSSVRRPDRKKKEVEFEV